MNHPSIIKAYDLDKQGNGTLLEAIEEAQLKSPNSLTWLHLDALHAEVKSYLEQPVHQLDSLTIEALLAEETRPRMQTHEEGVLLILRGVNLNEDADPEDMISVRLWVEEHKIITICRRPLKAISDVEQQIMKHKAPQSAGAFITMLANFLFRRMEPTIHGLDDTTDTIEEQILESTDMKLREAIVNVRKKAIMLRRYIAPQREAMEQLRMVDMAWIDDWNRRQFQESYNHVTRYIEDLDAVRERAQIMKDELANILSEKLNRNMYILSVIAAIFLPLGFLTGLLGINVGGIPGGDNNDAFLIFCAVLTLLVVMQIWLFKKFKWF